MKWQSHRDWAGWSFGWYPTESNPRGVTVQRIRWYCLNIDINLSERHDWRIQFVTRRNSHDEADRRHRGLRPTPRLSVRTYGKART